MVTVNGDNWFRRIWVMGMRGVWRMLRYGPSVLLEHTPPYRLIEGRITAKEVNRNGEFFILVGGSEIVEVDWLTYKILIEGEAIRVQSTRANRAITIDRLLP